MDSNQKDPKEDPETGPANEGSSGAGSTAKPPPWQVPKPDLRPELLNEPVTPVDPFAREREKQVNQAAARRGTAPACTRNGQFSPASGVRSCSQAAPAGTTLIRDLHLGVQCCAQIA